MYDERKAHLGDDAPEWPAKRVHLAAVRATVKRFLADLWVAWHEAEGAPGTTAIRQMSDAAERFLERRSQRPELEESPRVVDPALTSSRSTPCSSGAPAPMRGSRRPYRDPRDGRTYFVPVSAIDWIKGADYYVKLHVGGRVHLLREPLRSL